MELIFSSLSISGWSAVILFIIIALILAWRLFSYTNIAETSPYLVGLDHDGEEGADDIHDVQGDQGTTVEDDLKRIEGIGPKISGLLHDAGILTFRDLAGTDVDRLEEILDQAGINIADPNTWPEQAQHAADGEWDTLEEMQDDLKGGRKA